MPSSSRRAKFGRVPAVLLVAALALACRAPFLLHGDRFFDSDEAVEGLMARHVLQGEHPAFLWGQHYKGVPEIYLAAAVFSVTGSGVVPLKAVTLAGFAVFLCLQFVLVDRLFSRSIAWLSTVFLLAAPPAFVLWTLSANAEIVMTLVAGTAMCLAFDVSRRTGSRAALATAAFALGFGLWVQQFILYYVAALALAIFEQLPRRRDLLARLTEFENEAAWFRALLIVVVAVAGFYLILGTIAFFGGGFDLTAGRTTIGVHHPQKLWVIGASLAGVAAALQIGALLARTSSPEVWRPPLILAGAAFLAGYSPALVSHVVHGGSAPIGRATASAVTAQLPAIAGVVAPIVFGFRSPTTGWLPVPGWLALFPAAALAVGIFSRRARAPTSFFQFLLLATPLIFLLSGSFVDAQSYRYLMPAYGAVAVVAAAGIASVFQDSRTVGVVLLAGGVLTFGLQQRAWYQSLEPDRAREVVACLERNGVKRARADYWSSFKLTFLADEDILVAPATGVDRYPPYTQAVAEVPGAPLLTGRIDNLCDFSTSSGH